MGGGDAPKQAAKLSYVHVPQQWIQEAGRGQDVCGRREGAAGAVVGISLIFLHPEAQNTT